MHKGKRKIKLAHKWGKHYTHSPLDSKHAKAKAKGKRNLKRAAKG